jgi:hypothetical protein
MRNLQDFFFSKYSSGVSLAFPVSYTHVVGKYVPETDGNMPLVTIGDYLVARGYLTLKSKHVLVFMYWRRIFYALFKSVLISKLFCAAGKGGGVSGTK